MLLVSENAWCSEIRDLAQQVEHALKQVFAKDEELLPTLRSPLPQNKTRTEPEILHETSYSSAQHFRVHNERKEPLATPSPAGKIDNSENASSTDFDGVSTRFAGLFYLIRVLHFLSFPEFLSAYPALLRTNFAAQLLLHIGHRVSLQPDDPIALALSPESRDQIEPVSCAYPDAVTHLLSAPAPRCSLDSPSQTWLAATRRWCRRNPGLGLATLIRRSGRAVVSPTHLDVCFHLANADPRIRRAGLDIDPGWVPWLGRIVKFHYGDQY
jgi:hypothetical protein